MKWNSRSSNKNEYSWTKPRIDSNKRSINFLNQKFIDLFRAQFKSFFVLIFNFKAAQNPYFLRIMRVFDSFICLMKFVIFICYIYTYKLHMILYHIHFNVVSKLYFHIWMHINLRKHDSGITQILSSFLTYPYFGSKGKYFAKNIWH